MTTTYYEIRHAAGYGSEDHLADELIARAAVHLDLPGAAEHLCAAVGLAAHAVPLPRYTVRMHGPGARRTLERALTAARREWRNPHTRVYVACLRDYRTDHQHGTDWYSYVLHTDRRQGRHWVGESQRLIRYTRDPDTGRWVLEIDLTRG